MDDPIELSKTVVKMEDGRNLYSYEFEITEPQSAPESP